MTNGTPWWIKATLQLGIGAVFAFVLLSWLQTSVDRKLDLTLSVVQETRAAQNQAGLLMSTFAREQIRATEIMLLVQRQTCANTARSEEAGRGCWVTNPK